VADLPEMIGKYKIVSLVAKGGMGAVYKAVHPSLRRYVIIKKLTIRGNASIIERFKREAQILLDCNDPHIVHLFDYFKEGNSHYIVLEFVDGMSLDMLIKKRRYLSAPMSLLIFLDACRALKYAHDHGVIHRDIKPGNILISKTGDVKLADFGIAATEGDEDSGLTKEGMTLGTPSYMPPEQFENSKNVDKRADIYAMGVMLYEMVTGKKPFPGNFAPDTIMMIQKGRFTPAKRINPDIPPIIIKLIRRMIKPNPRKRFQDISQVIHIIVKYLRRFPVDQIVASLVECMTAQNYAEPTFKPRTKKRVVFLSVVLFLAAAGAGGYYAWTRGFVHRYLLPERFGAIRISVRVPSYLNDPEDLFLKASLFVNDRKDFPKAPVPEITFRRVNPVEGESALTYETDLLYVAPGAYRAKVLVENRIYWQSCSVEPLANPGKKEPRVQRIALSYDEVATRPLSVRCESYDALSGRNLTQATNVVVQDAGSWVPLDSVPRERLTTGAIRKFRAESKGYFPELFSLRIMPGQDELRLRASLVPLPGKLTVNSDKRLSLFVNGSDEVILGGEEMKRASLADYSGGRRTWELPAGRYEIEAANGKASARTVVVVEPGEETKLAITASDGALKIQKE